MKLTSEEARNVVDDEAEDWERVTSDRIEGTSRWSISYSAVFRNFIEDKFYEFNWSRGATEMQYKEPFENNKEVVVGEVVKKKKVVEYWAAPLLP